MKKNKVSKTGIIVAILLLAVGFAAVSTVLYITGFINIGPNEQDFEDKVVFIEPSVNNEDATAEIIQEGKAIKFVTQTLKSINETSVLSYKIKNESSYDAVLGKLTCSFVTDGEYGANAEIVKNYVELIPANTLENVELASGGTSANDTVTVKMKKSYAGDDNLTVEFTCSMAVTTPDGTTTTNSAN